MAGDSVVYRQQNGTALFVLGDQPVRLGIKAEGDTTETWQFAPLGSTS